MQDREDKDTLPDDTEAVGRAGAEQEDPGEPQAGAREIAAGVFILVVIIAGLAYSWFRGYDTGYLDGQDEERRVRLEQPRRTLPVGVEPTHFVVLKEGQRIRVILEGPGGESTDLVLGAGEGDRVVMAVGAADQGLPVFD